MDWKKLFAKGTIFERAGIPCFIWVGVLTLILNHWIYPFVSLRLPVKTVPLPNGYWDALPWIIGAVMGKKIGDKVITARDSLEKLDAGGDTDADWNKPHP